MKLVSWQIKLINIYVILYCFFLKEVVRLVKGNFVLFFLFGCFFQGFSFIQSGVFDVFEIVGFWWIILLNLDISSERYLFKSICEILVIKIYWLIIIIQVDWFIYRVFFGVITFLVFFVLFGFRVGYKMCIFDDFRIQCQ